MAGVDPGPDPLLRVISLMQWLAEYVQPLGVEAVREDAPSRPAAPAELQLARSWFLQGHNIRTHDGRQRGPSPGKAQVVLRVLDRLQNLSQKGSDLSLYDVAADLRIFRMTLLPRDRRRLQDACDKAPEWVREGFNIRGVGRDGVFDGDAFGDGTGHGGQRVDEYGNPILSSRGSKEATDPARTGNSQRPGGSAGGSRSDPLESGGGGHTAGGLGGEDPGRSGHGIPYGVSSNRHPTFGTCDEDDDNESGGGLGGNDPRFPGRPGDGDDSDDGIERDAYGNIIERDEHGNIIERDENGNVIERDAGGNIIKRDANGNIIDAEKEERRRRRHQNSQKSQGSGGIGIGAGGAALGKHPEEGADVGGLSIEEAGRSDAMLLESGAVFRVKEPTDEDRFIEKSLIPALCLDVGHDGGVHAPSVKPSKTQSKKNYGVEALLASQSSVPEDGRFSMGGLRINLAEKFREAIAEAWAAVDARDAGIVAGGLHSGGTMSSSEGKAVNSKRNDVLLQSSEHDAPSQAPEGEKSLFEKSLASVDTDAGVSGDTITFAKVFSSVGTEDDGTESAHVEAQKGENEAGRESGDVASCRYFSSYDEGDNGNGDHLAETKRLRLQRYAKSLQSRADTTIRNGSNFGRWGRRLETCKRSLEHLATVNLDTIALFDDNDFSWEDDSAMPFGLVS